MWFKDFLARFDSQVIDGIVNLSGRSTRLLAVFSGWVDKTFVDGAVNLVADGTLLGGVGARKLQTGKIQNYLLYAVGGIVLVLLYRLV